VSSPAVKIENLRFGYPDGGFTLQVDELALDSGQHIALVGRSGCGKTTLANLIAGILVPRAGSVTVAGHPVSSLPDRERRAFRSSEVGFVFQDFALLDYLPVLGNLLLPYTINRAHTATPADRERALDIATSVGLADKLDRHPAQLSGGERQRLAVARALVTEPALVIADEPTGNLDRQTADEVIAELLSRAGDATVIAITHDEGLLPRFDRTVDVSAFSNPR
jgi:putative ABC transport system ATP-binding protein